MLELKQIESFYPQSLRPYRRNLLREYLHYKILEIIFNSRYGNKVSFMGGTAIHIVHAMPRFSEDLDFDNRGLDKRDFEALTERIANRLELEGCLVETRNVFKGAFRSYMRIGRVLYEEGLSAHSQEKLLVEVDMEPQRFKYTSEKVILNKFDVFTRINVVPVDILLAQKLCAILLRKRPIGRDFYDAIFLMGKTGPNPGYLKERLDMPDMEAVEKALIRRVEKIDLRALMKDIEPFLFVSEDAKKILLFEELLLKVWRTLQ